MLENEKKIVYAKVNEIFCLCGDMGGTLMNDFVKLDNMRLAPNMKFIAEQYILRLSQERIKEILEKGSSLSEKRFEFWKYIAMMDGRANQRVAHMNRYFHVPKIELETAILFLLNLYPMNALKETIKEFEQIMNRSEREHYRKPGDSEDTMKACSWRYDSKGREFVKG